MVHRAVPQPLPPAPSVRRTAGGLFERQPDAPLVSEPERAVLEVLSDVGVRRSLQDARDLLEGTSSLRSGALRELLVQCRQVKTVRLCLAVGRELRLPWVEKLDANQLPTGSDQRWVGRSKDGLLVLKARHAS